MENASKALIISACILLGILVISLGISIYMNASAMSDKGSGAIDALYIKQLNSQYELYDGVRKGNDVKRLLKLASKNNEELYQQQETIKYCVCIRSNIPSIIDKFSGNSEMIAGLNGSRYYGVRYPENISEISECISSYTTYKIWLGYNDEGIVWEINIDKFH